MQLSPGYFGHQFCCTSASIPIIGRSELILRNEKLELLRTVLMHFQAYYYQHLGRYSYVAVAKVEPIKKRFSPFIPQAGEECFRPDRHRK